MRSERPGLVLEQSLHSPTFLTIATFRARDCAGARGREFSFRSKKARGMSVVASALSQLMYKVDALQAKVNKLSSENEYATTNAGQEREPSAEWAQKSDLEDAVTELKGMIEEAKGQSTGGLRKERGVIEAVLTQKMDKSVTEKVQAALDDRDKSASATVTPEVRKSDLDRLSDRLNKVSTEVDRQAKFLASLDDRIQESIRKLMPADAKQERAAAGGASETELEDAPALDLDRGEGEREEADGADGDEIDLTQTSDDTKTKKGKGATRKRK